MLEGNITNGSDGIENMGLATKSMPIAAIIRKLWSFFYENGSHFEIQDGRQDDVDKKWNPAFSDSAYPKHSENAIKSI
jgi:hypothetical protein